MFPCTVIDVIEDFDQFRSTLDVDSGEVEPQTTGVRRDVLRHASGRTKLSLGKTGDPHHGVAGETAVELHSGVLFELDGCSIAVCSVAAGSSRRYVADCASGCSAGQWP